MLYYGSERRDVPVREALAAVRAHLEAARVALSHDLLVALLVEASALAQGVADAQLDAVGRDEPNLAVETALEVVRAAAAAVSVSWAGGAPGGLELAGAALERLARVEELPPVLPVRAPEGYAHYGVFPELYSEAARGLGGGPLVVIGIRSIGVGLGAVVASATGAGELVTVRPVGHPFDRRLALGGDLAARVSARIAEGTPFAIVDEGPGLSGSSFAAVARWLEDAGCLPSRIVLFPAHAGPPGSVASADVRAWWDRTEKRVVGFEAALRPRLEAWAARELGAAELTDLSAGAWRGCFAGTDDLPVFRQQERRKLLARTSGGAYLLRFAGLGTYLERARARADALADGGFGPGVVGAVHGFLAQRWIEGRPVPAGAVSRERWLAHLARYLAFRARMLPVGPRDGASPPALLQMLRVNAGEALGAEAGRATAELEAGAREASRLARCAIDGKLERWEWLLDEGGALAKGDAIDHCSGHDLVGPQPIGWDIAGAAVELELGSDGAAELAARVSAAGGGATPRAALTFFEAAYLAHRLGRWTFALASERDAAERVRIGATLDRYGRLLSAALASGRGRLADDPSIDGPSGVSPA